MTFGGMVGGVGKIVGGLLAAAGVYYSYMQYDLSVRQYEEQKQEKVAPTTTSVVTKSDPLVTKASVPAIEQQPAQPIAKPAIEMPQAMTPPPVRETAPAASAAAPPRREELPKQVALAPLPAPLGSQLNQRPPEPPREEAKREPPKASPSVRVVTAIEGESFVLCGQPDFTISMFQPGLNAPTAVSLRRYGMMMADGLSLRLSPGKPRAVLDDCEVAFIEVKPGFKPVAVLEERRKQN